MSPRIGSESVMVGLDAAGSRLEPSKGGSTRVCMLPLKMDQGCGYETRVGSCEPRL